MIAQDKDQEEKESATLQEESEHEVAWGSERLIGSLDAHVTP